MTDTFEDKQRAEVLARLAAQGVPVEPLLTATEVQAFLGLKPRHFERVVKDGVLPAPIRIGKIRRWRMSDLTRYLETTPRISNSHAA